VQRIGRAARAGMQADGLTILQFNDVAGGQSVFHLHFHAIPRFDGQPLRPHGGAMADRVMLEAQAAKIRAALAG
jgi:histidine triad (HIT) family protein